MTHHNPDEKKQEEEKSYRDYCAKEADDAFERINKNQEEYDKQILTLGVGFLGVSLAFIKDVVPLNQAVHLALLHFSFVLLTLSIVSVIASYQISIWGQFRARKYWEDVVKNPSAPFPIGNAKAMGWINLGSGILFLAGIALSVSFVILNLSHGAAMSSNRPISEDRCIRTPSQGEERGAYIKVPPPRPQSPTQQSGNSQQSGGAKDGK